MLNPTSSSTAVARPKLPESERTADAIRWLAVAFIAEAGWADPKHREARADHRGVFHVLRRRWSRAVKRWPNLTFVHMVQNYVAAFDSRTQKGGRVRWLLSLQPGSDRPPAGWPSRSPWPPHLRWWKQAQKRAARCINGGHCPDPYPTAWNWGGDMDMPSTCMVELPNVGTANTFYTLDLVCRRAAIAKRVAAAKKRRSRKR